MLIETQYFPPISFWAQAYKAKEITLEAHENYQKRSYRNKCKILSVNNLLTLSVPLLHGKNSRKPIKDVQIDYTSSWNTHHWQSIRSAYGSSPYYEFYEDEIKPFFQQKHKFLYDFNFEIIQYFADNFDIQLKESTDYSKASEHDFRQKILPSRAWKLPEYDQVFSDRHPFQSNLSIIDLIFCLGPEASLYLRKLDLDL